MEQRQKQPTNKGSAEWFTGEVWSTRLLKGIRPSKLNIGAVYFTPGAPTAWHSHEGGQTFYVTEGRGLVQSRGERAVEIRPGDVIYTPTGEEHWHGDTSQHFLTNLSITEGAAQWGPHVTDAEYQASPPHWRLPRRTFPTRSRRPGLAPLGRSRRSRPAGRPGARP